MSDTPTQPDALGAFIETAKQRGLPDDALVPLLKQNGWSERRVYRSLSQYYASALGIAPPARGGRGVDARDAFLYLLNFITLGFWVVALGNLFATLIDRAFPDAASSAYSSHPALLEAIAWQLATIIVAFPCFVIIGRLIAGEISRRPEAADSAIRAWLTYAALIVAALCILGNAIWVLQAFLTGALTVRFSLDSLDVIGLGTGVFVYYLASLRQPAPAVER
jgi:hypothetical protein